MKSNRDRLFKEILESTRENTVLLREILHRLKPRPLTAAIAVKFTGESLMANNTLVFNVGQTSQASIQPLLADGVTPSGGVLSNVAYAFTDQSATVVLNTDGLTATVTGVAPSTGPVDGTATCTVTDTDGVVSTWTQPFTITTLAVVPPPPPPAQLTQSIAVAFTAPA
jgi:hypothetical protein